MKAGASCLTRSEDHASNMAGNDKRRLGFTRIIQKKSKSNLDCCVLLIIMTLNNLYYI